MQLPHAFPALAGSLAQIREAVRVCAEAAGTAPPVVAAAVIAVNEAATNAIVHGHGGGDAAAVLDIRSVDQRPGWVGFTVTDHGAGFHPRRNSPGIGLGLAIIAQYADEFALHECDDGGMRVVVEFRLAG